MSAASIQIPTRVELALADTSYDAVLLSEDRRVGIFKWVTGDFTAHHAADTAQALFVKSSAYASTVGSWVRQGVIDLLLDWFSGTAWALDGTVDLGAAIDRAYAVSKLVGVPRRLLLPKGHIKTTLNHFFNTPFRISGAGHGRYQYIANPATQGTLVTCTNYAPFTFDMINNGDFGLDNMEIDGSSLANIIIEISECLGGKWHQLFVRNSLIACMRVRAAIWCRFEDLQMEDTSSGGMAVLWLSGFYLGNGVAHPTKGNTCHNYFSNIHLSFNGSRHGLLMGYCDNNLFNMCYFYKQGGAGAGVYCDGTEVTSFPANNSWTHLESSSGGFVANAACAGNFLGNIFGYALGNSEPNINIGAANLFAIDALNGMSGVRGMGGGQVGYNRHWAFTFPTGVTSFVVPLNVAQLDNKYVVMVEPSHSFPPYWITDKTATTFRVNIATVVTTAVPCHYILEGYK